MSFDVDLSEVFALVESLEVITQEIYPRVDVINSRGALNIKNEMIADVSASPHFRGMAPSISYEHHNTKSTITREIGPDKERPGGALGNIYYFGTSRGGGSGDIDKALNNEAPRYEKSLTDLADALGRRL